MLSYGGKCSPENLLKKYLELFLPMWTKLVNLSLMEGSMKSLKCAASLPLIKDLDEYIDKGNLKNYKPVSS